MTFDPSLKRKTLRKLLRHGATSRAARLAEKLLPAEIAEVVSVLSRSERSQLTELLVTAPHGVDVLRALPGVLLDRLFDTVPDDRLVAIVAAQEAVVTALVLEHLPTTRCRTLCRALAPEHLRSVDSYLRAPRLSALRARVAAFLSRRREA